MKTLENYKFKTNTNPGENLLGFIQGQIRQYVIPDGFYSQLFNITLYTERYTELFHSSMTDIHFTLTPKVSVPYKILEAICNEILEAINEEFFEGFLEADQSKDNMIIYSVGPNNWSTMVGIINEELSFNICLMVGVI